MPGWGAMLRGAVVGAVAAIVMLVTGGLAVAAGPTLEVGPAELALAPGEKASVQLVFRNDGDAPAAVEQVTAAAVPGLRITLPQPSAFGSVAAGSAAAATVTVEATDGFLGGTVPVTVIGRQGEQFVAVAALTVTVRPPDPALTVTVVGAPGTIGDGEARPVTVQVTNPSAHVWSNLTVRATGSESLCLTLPEAGSCPPGMALAAIPLAAALEPGGMVEQALTLHAADGVRPGPQTISVVAAADRDGTPLTRNIGTAEFTATTTVFGLDLLSPFGLTTLLLVPGTVAVLTFQLARRLLRGPAAGAADIDIKDPGALLFIVPVGVLVYLAALAVLNHDLRADVSSADVTVLFLAGISIGVLVAAAWWCRWWWVVGRKTFRPGDSPDKVVRRLDRRRGSLIQPTTTINGAEFQVLAEGEDRRMVCQRVAYRFGDGLDATRRGEFARAADDLDVAAVWSAVKRGDVQLDWVPSAGPTGVTDLAATGELNPARHLLVQDPNV